MPYQIVRKGTGYVVENKETGRQYSKKPQPKSRAESQMRLLQGIEHGMIPRKKKDT